MEKASQAKRIYFWVHHAIYLAAILVMAILVLAFGKTPYVFSLGGSLFLIFVSEALRIVSVWLYRLSSQDEKYKKSAAITRIVAFDISIVFVIAILYVDRYFLLEGNSFFYMAAMFLGLMLFVLSFFRGNGWTKYNEFSLLGKFRIIGFVLMFVLAAFGFLVTTVVNNDFSSGYRAFMFIPFAVIAVSVFAIRFYQIRFPKIRNLWLLIEASVIVLASMCICFAF